MSVLGNLRKTAFYNRQQGYFWLKAKKMETESKAEWL